MSARFCNETDCGKPIVFAKHHRTHKTMVFDFEPVVDGEWVIANDGFAYQWAEGFEGARRRTHFATCTKPERFRR